MENQQKNLFAAMFWWIKIVVMGLISLFFLLYGAETMTGAYSLKNPMEFIMYFFSASFMILVSSVGVIYSFFKIYGRLKAPEKKDAAPGASEP
jgi:hypothetical protein